MLTLPQASFVLACWSRATVGPDIDAFAALEQAYGPTAATAHRRRSPAQNELGHCRRGTSLTGLDASVGWPMVDVVLGSHVGLAWCPG
ncbi:hypothetical protein ACU686_12925 [Yinghuangia aomiensis]